MKKKKPIKKPIKKYQRVLDSYKQIIKAKESCIIHLLAKMRMQREE